ncbi:MAG: PIN domain-containing protein, partial [Gemmatimonadetes bacterium]|nr:PIN domain-containing protein [Gemmatimonadota bacterium]
VLLDTGPLVAFLNRRDEYHEWAMAQWGQIAPPMLTCEAVLSEACFLLSRMHGGSEPVMDLLQRKIVIPSFRLEDQIRPVQKLLQKYRSVPMSLADACLIRMSELYPENRVLTLDSDFSLYRRNGRQVIPVIMPQ